jgi:chromosome segregation ATPase
MAECPFCAFFGFDSEGVLNQKLNSIFKVQSEMLTAQRAMLEQIRHIVESQEQIVRSEHSQTKRDKAMKVDLSDLRAQVRHLSDVGEGVKTLVNGLGNKVEELGNQPTVDPEELKALAEEIRQVSDSMAEAVVNKTPFEH